MGRKRRPSPDLGFAATRDMLLAAFDPNDPLRYLVLADLHREHGLDAAATRLAKTAANVGRPGRTLHTMKCSWSARSVAFSPCGAYVAAGDFGQHVRVWDSRTGERLADRYARGGPDTRVRFSPDGGLIVAGGCSGVEVYDWRADRLAFEADTGWGLSGDVCFSPDGLRVAGGGDGPAIVWEVATGRELMRAEAPTPVDGQWDGVQCLDFSPDGTRLAVSAGERPLEVLDASTGAVVWRGGQAVSALAYSRDGRLAAAGDDWFARVHDPAGGVVASYEFESAVETLRFSPDGSLLLAAGHEITLWDTRGDEPARRLGDRQGGINCADFAPDGRRIAYGTDGDRVRVIWFR